jgi:tetratricopeptide (TPR) repeat protein
MARVTRDLQTGNAADAIPILKGQLARNDGSYELHLFLGDAYYDVKRYREAADEYTAARLINPSTAEPVAALARAYLSLGDVAEASREAAEAARLEPESEDTLLVGAMVLEQEGNAAGAIAAYAKAIAANGSNPQPRVRLAALAMRMGLYDRAAEQFDTLLRLKYRPSRMHFGLGQIAQARGDTAKAAAEFRIALRLEPTFAQAREALGRVQGR